MGKIFAAQFGQVLLGGDAQLGRKRLDEHGQQVAAYHHPEQRIAEAGSAGEIGGVIAGVDIGHGGDEGGAEKRQQGTEPALARAAFQHLLRGNFALEALGAESLRCFTWNSML